MRLPTKPVGRIRRVPVKTYNGSCVPAYVDSAGWIWSGPASSSFNELEFPHRIERAKRCKQVRIVGIQRRRR